MKKAKNRISIACEDQYFPAIGIEFSGEFKKEVLERIRLIRNEINILEQYIEDLFKDKG